MRSRLSRLLRRGSALLSAALGVCGLLPIESANAQDIADLPPAQGDQASFYQGLDQTRPFWESGQERFFMSAVMDAGVVFFRPTLQLGYGKPHLFWGGAEMYSTLTTSGTAMYAGVRASLPYVDVRGGARYAMPVNQFLLRPRYSYTAEQSDYEAGPRSQYVAAEGDATVFFPAPGGSAFGGATVFYVTGVDPGNWYLFEDALNVIMNPPWLWRLRAGYRYHFGVAETFRFGVAGEVISSPNRPGKNTYRMGPSLSVALTHHLETVGAMLFVLSSPDELGIRGADFGQLALRYRWATGDRWPEFP